MAWGDYHFGHSLAKAFESLGVKARVVYQPRWSRLARLSLRRGIDLAIRGNFGYAPRIWPWVRFYLWVISYDNFRPEEVRAIRHVFAASQQIVDEQRALGRSASVLPQCTDSAIFAPDKARDTLVTDVLFVGSWREHFPRPIVATATAAGFPPKVWGSRWSDKYPPELFGGALIPNHELGAHYASAKVVLNDHLPQMLAKGIISNRVYDVLASGTELVSDALPDLGRDLPGAALGRTTAEVGAAIAEALAHDETRKSDRLELAEYIRTHHSFHERARDILAVINAKSA
ncbi:MAG: glycosyltransferase [Deltaproteobacteria bacterium]